LIGRAVCRFDGARQVRMAADQRLVLIPAQLGAGAGGPFKLTVLSDRKVPLIECCRVSVNM
jgi:hypothetical protein